MKTPRRRNPSRVLTAEMDAVKALRSEDRAEADLLGVIAEIAALVGKVMDQLKDGPMVGAALAVLETRRNGLQGI